MEQHHLPYVLYDFQLVLTLQNDGTFEHCADQNEVTRQVYLG